jgi:hypothetical protein
MRKGRWEKIGEGRWRWVSGVERPTPARSDLAFPMVISDEMPETEQVDGRFYTSKAKFRAVGRALGLTEVGTEKLKPRQRYNPYSRENKAKRMATLQKAITEYKQGRRPKGSASF